MVKKELSKEILPKNNKVSADPIILIERIKNGDSTAFDELAGKYEPLLRSVCSSFENSVTEIGGTSTPSELRQELDIALYRAAKTYDVARTGVTFGKYAKRCLTNCAISQLRKLRAAKRKHDRAIIKLEGNLKSERHAHTFDTYFAEYGSIDKQKILEKTSEILSSYEFTVFNRYLDGAPAGVISKELDTDEKSVNNAIFRSKKKVSGLLKTFTPEEIVGLD